MVTVKIDWVSAWMRARAGTSSGRAARTVALGIRPDRELDDAGRVAYAQLLVEQRSGRDDSFAVHDDGDGVEAGVRVADHQAQVVGIGRVTPRRQ